LKASLKRSPTRAYAHERPRAVPEADAGLPGTLAQVYQQHIDFVWRNARRLGMSSVSADDVVQDVFMVVQRRLGDFDIGTGSMRSWLFGILLRVVHDHRRSHRRKTKRWVSLEQYGAQAEQALGYPPTPSDLAERSERVRLVDALLDQLEAEQRTLIVLAELEQWTIPDIARHFGCDVKVVYSKLRNARRQFEKVYRRATEQRGETP
jgi:RNA polymerase sigma-70 factor (ECF subfamily)